MNEWRPILCLDFDGVLHSYTSGWQGPAVIPDPPVSGALEFLEEAVKHFKVCIYSARSGQHGGIDAMRIWLLEHGLAGEVFDEIEWPTKKPSAFVSLDDRVITFTGEWPDMQTLKDFKPWNKKNV